MFLTDSSNIKEVLLFPAMKPINTIAQGESHDCSFLVDDSMTVRLTYRANVLFCRCSRDCRPGEGCGRSYGEL
jgi:hypothetical protein